MKKVRVCIILSIALCAAYPGTGHAEGHSIISLPAPRTTGGKPLMEALSQRQSVRNFAPRELPDQVLSDLLWAAFGINRKESGKRTAPTAGNRQEIDIYVATARGVFVYDAAANTLARVIEGDARALTGRQAFVKDAPVVLIYVADYRRMRGDESQKDFYAATNTGYISQNAYLFCASEELATVVLGMVDRDTLSQALGLVDEQKIVLTQPVGYTAE